MIFSFDFILPRWFILYIFYCTENRIVVSPVCRYDVFGMIINCFWCVYKYKVYELIVTLAQKLNTLVNNMIFFCFTKYFFIHFFFPHERQAVIVIVIIMLGLMEKIKRKLSLT